MKTGKETVGGFIKKTAFSLADNRGITLVETVVASLLLVIGTLVLSTGFIAATRMMTISAADKKSAQSVIGVMNGGVRGSTSDSGKNITITFSVDSFDFSVNVVEDEFVDDTNENIVFYRLN